MAPGRRISRHAAKAGILELLSLALLWVPAYTGITYNRYASVAVVGSIMRRTSVTLLAGKPLRLACS